MNFTQNQGKIGGPSHVRYLDGIRGLAALLVVLCHAYLQSFPIVLHRLPEGRTWTYTGWLLYAGHFAVVVFLVLSGYCLTLPVLREPIPQLRQGVGFFFRRRAWRILPAYLCACIFSLALIYSLIGQKTGTHWDISIPVTAEGVFWHFLLLQDVFGYRIGGQINHAFWSIAVEWHIYFLFPILVALWRRYNIVVVTASAALVSYGAWWTLQQTVFKGLSIHYLSLFAAGMLAAAIVHAPSGSLERARIRFPWAFVALALGILVYVFCTLWSPYNIFEYRLPLLDPIVGVITMCLLVFLATSSPTLRVRSLLESQILVAIGSFSYSLYLIHAPLLQVIWQYGIHPLTNDPRLSFALLVAVGTPIIVVASRIFYGLCERPFLPRTNQKDNSGVVAIVAKENLS